MLRFFAPGSPHPLNASSSALAAAPPAGHPSLAEGVLRACSGALAGCAVAGVAAALQQHARERRYRLPEGSAPAPAAAAAPPLLEDAQRFHRLAASGSYAPSSSYAPSFAPSSSYAPSFAPSSSYAPSIAPSSSYAPSIAPSSSSAPSSAPSSS